MESFFQRYEYDIQNDRIGSGAFGTVYKAYDNFLNQYKALKIAEIKNIDGKVFSLVSEFEASKAIPPHKNIAHYEAVHQFRMPNGFFDYAIMQYYPEGNLKQLLHNRKLGIPEKKSIIDSILSGIDILHKHNVLHRDIKPSNVLIAVDNRGKFVPKISDFGLSKLIMEVETDSIANSFVGGTLDYSPPEQLGGNKLRYNADLWAFGVIVYEIFTGKKPFDASDYSGSPSAKRMQFLQNIHNAKLPEDVSECPKPYDDVIRMCLIKDPVKRVQNAFELIEFIQNPIPILFPIDWINEEETLVFHYDQNIIKDITKEKDILEYNKNKHITTNSSTEQAILNELKKQKDENAKRIKEENEIKIAADILKKQTEKFNKLIGEGDEAYQLGRYPEAQAAYFAAIKIFPNEKHPQKQLAEVERVIHERQKEAEIEARIRAEFKELTIEGDQFFKAGQYEEAIKTYDIASKLIPANQTVINKKVRAEDALNKKKKNALLEKKTLEYNLLLTEGNVKLENQNFEEAIILFKKAHDLIPEKPLALKKIKETESLWTENIKFENEKIEKAELLIEKAKQLINIKKYTSALEALHQADDLKPEFPEIKKLKEKTKILLHEEEAERQAEDKRIAALNEEFKNLMDTASNLKNKGRYVDAVKIYKKALLIKPEDTEPSQRIIDCEVAINKKIEEQKKELDIKKLLFEANRLEYKGLFKEAKEILIQVINLDPSRKDLKNRLNNLDILIKKDEAVKPLPISTNRDLKQVEEFQAVINNANKLFNNQQWIEAKAAYRLALQIIPGDKIATKKLKEVEKILSGKKQKKKMPLIFWLMLIIIPVALLTFRIFLKKTVDIPIKPPVIKPDTISVIGILPPIGVFPPNPDTTKTIPKTSSKSGPTQEGIETGNLPTKNDITMWNEIAEGRNLGAINEFIATNPNHQKIEDAKRLKKQLEEEENEWNKIAEGRNLGAINEFITTNPNHQKLKDAKRLKKQLEEEETEWNKIKYVSDIDILRAYITKYELSIFNQYAKQRIKLLESLDPKVYRIEREFIRLRGGQYTLGCKETNRGCDPKDGIKKVTIQPFYISKYEVTQRDFNDIMGYNPSYYKDCSNCPVDNVSFNDAIQFINKLNEKANHIFRYRLPTEAEWEYAANAGSTYPFSGSSDVTQVGVVNKMSGTERVGHRRKANGFGIFDMSGNVAELTSDWYNPFDGSKSESKFKVLRGGSYRNKEDNAMVKYRDKIGARVNHTFVGFRVVRDILKDEI